MNVSNFLVALGFLISVLSSLRGIEALLKELERLVKITLILELDGDDLIDSN